MDLVQFFVTFFSCFLSLLLVAAVVWKIKQSCWASRRREVGQTDAVTASGNDLRVSGSLLFSEEKRPILLWVKMNVRSLYAARQGKKG
ncbi:Attractin like 1 [Crotalus adamanteus]|uniref:Attractin like 1 n=1 Tax=Crotalus adamanteus TaxID=8729 RepID=A0AAW1B9G0_CROAD